MLLVVEPKADDQGVQEFLRQLVPEFDLLSESLRAQMANQLVAWVRSLRPSVDHCN